jgi:hypothetical protein
MAKTLAKSTAKNLTDDYVLAGACRVCGWPLRPSAVTCRWCDDAFDRAMRKAKAEARRIERRMAKRAAA